MALDLRIEEASAAWEDADMNAVDLMQEVVEITVESGAAKSVWRRWEVEVHEVCEVGGRIQECHPCGEMRSWCLSEGTGSAAQKFLDADVNRPLASVGAVVGGERNRAPFGVTESHLMKLAVWRP